MASGLEGVCNKIEPPPMFEGDVYSARDLPSIPTSLEQALELFRESEFAKKSFGEDVHRHYIRFFEVEIESFQAAVTDWELRRYFERI